MGLGPNRRRFRHLVPEVESVYAGADSCSGSVGRNPGRAGTDSSLHSRRRSSRRTSISGVTSLPGQRWLTAAAARILRLPPRPDDWIAVTRFGEPPELVVIGGRIHLIGPELAEALPPALRRKFHPLQIQNRPPVLVRWNIPQLLEDTRRSRAQARFAWPGERFSLNFRTAVR